MREKRVTLIKLANICELPAAVGNLFLYYRFNEKPIHRWLNLASNEDESSAKVSQTITITCIDESLN